MVATALAGRREDKSLSVNVEDFALDAPGMTLTILGRRRSHAHVRGRHELPGSTRDTNASAETEMHTAANTGTSDQSRGCPS